MGKFKSKIAVIKFTGGLGNEMFQYSFGEYLKLKGINVYYDTSSWFFFKDIKLRISKMNIKIRRLNFFISALLFLLDKINFPLLIFREKAPFKSQVFSLNPLVYYVGYWQHISYVEENKNHLQKCFQYRINNSQVTDLISTLSSNSIGIHVRRGDYVNNPTHETIGIKYFSDAIKYINNKVQEPYFYIISDDINWCKQNLNFDNCTFIDFSNNEFEDFEILKNCQHKIISNSTFSWWAAFLGEIEGSITICPKKWTNKIESVSLQIPNWILIS